MFIYILKLFFFIFPIIHTNLYAQGFGDSLNPNPGKQELENVSNKSAIEPAVSKREARPDIQDRHQRSIARQIFKRKQTYAHNSTPEPFTTETISQSLTGDFKNIFINGSEQTQQETVDLINTKQTDIITHARQLNTNAAKLAEEKAKADLAEADIKMREAIKVKTAREAIIKYNDRIAQLKESTKDDIVRDALLDNPVADGIDKILKSQFTSEQAEGEEPPPPITNRQFQAQFSGLEQQLVQKFNSLKEGAEQDVDSGKNNLVAGAQLANQGAGLAQTAANLGNLGGNGGGGSNGGGGPSGTTITGNDSFPKLDINTGDPKADANAALNEFKRIKEEGNQNNGISVTDLEKRLEDIRATKTALDTLDATTKDNLEKAIDEIPGLKEELAKLGIDPSKAANLAELNEAALTAEAAGGEGGGSLGGASLAGDAQAGEDYADNSDFPFDGAGDFSGGSSSLNGAGGLDIDLPPPPDLGGLFQAGQQAAAGGNASGTGDTQIVGLSPGLSPGLRASLELTNMRDIKDRAPAMDSIPGTEGRYINIPIFSRTKSLIQRYVKAGDVGSS